MMTLTLGQLKDELQKYSEVHSVFYDCLPLAQPTTFDSWRGSYDQLALGHEATTYTTNNVTVKALLDAIKSANGRTFKGWKGGSYNMNYSTPVWVENRGCYTGVKIVGTKFDRGFVLIRTEGTE